MLLLLVWGEFLPFVWGQPRTTEANWSWERGPKQATGTLGLPWQELPVAVREEVRRVVDKPTLFVQGPAEEFIGCPKMYHWLLDHPDRAAQAWHRLGTPVLCICNQGNGQFSWSDGQGTDVRWQTVYRAGGLRVWYAEGAGRPGWMLPTVTVRAVVVLRHDERPLTDGVCRLGHQADMFVQTDSKTAKILARLLGPSIPQYAQEGLAQMEFFFSALVRYFDLYPEKAPSLLLDDRRSNSLLEPTPPATGVLQPLHYGTGSMP
ncbi:MAG: hypothetical protein ACK4RK_07730 [Gemmataceae bacterium]